MKKFILCGSMFLAMTAFQAEAFTLIEVPGSITGDQSDILIKTVGKVEGYNTSYRFESFPGFPSSGSFSSSLGFTAVVPSPPGYVLPNWPARNGDITSTGNQSFAVINADSGFVSSYDLGTRVWSHRKYHNEPGPSLMGMSLPDDLEYLNGALILTAPGLFGLPGIAGGINKVPLNPSLPISNYLYGMNFTSLKMGSDRLLYPITAPVQSVPPGTSVPLNPLNMEPSPQSVDISAETIAVVRNQRGDIFSLTRPSGSQGGYTLTKRLLGAAAPTSTFNFPQFESITDMDISEDGRIALSSGSMMMGVTVVDESLRLLGRIYPQNPVISAGLDTINTALRNRGPSKYYCLASGAIPTARKISSVTAAQSGISWSEPNRITFYLESPNGYENLKYLRAQVTAGSTLVLNVSTSSTPPTSDNERIAIFIDLNMDGDLADAGELVYKTPAGLPPPVGTPAPGVPGTPTMAYTQITIPRTLSSGKRLMRVIYGNDSYIPPSGCGVLPQGQVQDYTINIVGGSGIRRL